jgi:hypothetical protein
MTVKLRVVPFNFDGETMRPDKTVFSREGLGEGYHPAEETFLRALGLMK